MVGLGKTWLWDLVVGLGGTWWDLVVGLGCGTWWWDWMGLDGGTWWDFVGLVGGTWWWDLMVGLVDGTWWDLVVGLGGTWENSDERWRWHRDALQKAEVYNTLCRAGHSSQFPLQQLQTRRPIAWLWLALFISFAQGPWWKEANSWSGLAALMAVRNQRFHSDSERVSDLKWASGRPLCGCTTATGAHFK